jgi:protein SCO1/2
LIRRPARAVALVVATLVLSTSCSSSHATPPPTPGPSVGQQLDAALPASLQQAVLVSSTGERLTLGSLAGKVLVISDMMTLCQETCPLDTANVVAAARAAERAGLGKRVEFLSITIDPARDTPQRLAAYRKLYAPAPANWLLLTGDGSTIAAFWKRLGVYIQKTPDKPPAPRDWLTGRPLTYDLTHSDEVFFVDPRGHERFVLEGAPQVAADAPIPARLKRFLDARGRHNLAHPDALAWTLPQELKVLSWLTGRRLPGAGS